MYCEYCGNEMPEGAVLCTKCKRFTREFEENLSRFDSGVLDDVSIGQENNEREELLPVQEVADVEQQAADVVKEGETGQNHVTDEMNENIAKARAGESAQVKSSAAPDHCGSGTPISEKDMKKVRAALILAVFAILSALITNYLPGMLLDYTKYYDYIAIIFCWSFTVLSAALAIAALAVGYNRLKKKGEYAKLFALWLAFLAALYSIAVAIFMSMHG